jgi:hypothetical protein
MAASAFSKASIWVDWMSTKKKAGASLGMRLVICSRRFPSISAVATSTVSPSPSDSMTMGVGAPGRCRLARASRSPANLGLPARAAASIRSRAKSGKAMKAPIAPSTNQPAIRRLSAVKMVKPASASATAPISSASRQTRRPPWTTAPLISVAAETRRARNNGIRANSSETSRPNTAAMVSGQA